MDPRIRIRATIFTDLQLQHWFPTSCLFYDATDNRRWIRKCRSTYVLLDDGGVDLEEVGPDVLRGDGVGVAHHEGGQDGHQSRIVLGQRHNHLNRRSRYFKTLMETTEYAEC
jgi:hypothetical protein